MGTLRIWMSVYSYIRKDVIRSLKCNEFCEIAEHLGIMQATHENTDGVYVRCNEIRLHGSFLWKKKIDYYNSNENQMWLPSATLILLFCSPRKFSPKKLFSNYVA